MQKDGSHDPDIFLNLKKKLDVNVYHVNTQKGSPSHFSNKSYTFILFFADNQIVHVIIK